jgi:hypothetical protein
MPRRDTVYFIRRNHGEFDEGNDNMERWENSGWEIMNPVNPSTPFDRFKALSAAAVVAVVQGWEKDIYARAEAVLAAFLHKQFHAGDSMGMIPTPNLTIIASDSVHVG